MSNQKDSCFHCATPIPKGVNVELSIDGKQESFCCPACRAVTQTILGSGLEKYYQHRGNQQQERPTEIESEDQLALYDNESIQAPFVRTIDADRKEALFVIEGIH